MGGRRCIITRVAAELPQDAPATAAGRKRVEKLVRTLFQNPSIAGQLDDDVEYEAIVGALSADPMSATQLQFLMDKINGIPPTD